jgi:hypothetical protein
MHTTLHVYDDSVIHIFSPIHVFTDMQKKKLRTEGETLFPGDSARGARPAESDEGKWLPLTSRFEGPDIMNYRSVYGCIHMFA